MTEDGDLAPQSQPKAALPGVTAVDKAVCPHDLRFTYECLRADWDVNNSSISKAVLLVHRVGHLLWSRIPDRAAGRPLRIAYRLVDLIWVKLLAGAELPDSCCVGPALRLPHGGRGVVVVQGTRIGRDVAIYHQVTVGSNVPAYGTWPLPIPTLGDGVRIGTGAKVLGGVHVGDGALIGANAVVLKDVPENARVKAGSRWAMIPQ